MKGVICAGGLGTCLYPLTHATNKHLLPVYDRPMVYYPIQTLVKAGIRDIIIVTGGPYAGDFMRVLGDGRDLDASITYAYQAKEGGIADAIATAERYVDGDRIAVILGDNCTDADISGPVKYSWDEPKGAMIFLKEVPDPHRFGVVKFAEFDKSDMQPRTIEEIIEKPETPPSNMAVTGLYLYDNTVFDRIKQLKPSGRGELEVTDLNNSYLRDGQLTWTELDGFWRDAGTFDTLYEVNEYWKKLKKK